ncbi:unnamed protein product, partial [Mesorhabditis belari]|uniref:Spliceosome-associated protein CWC27 homolog n=1 Tax=Mesorhabditis belari TaxID=2138241 RepID=A0AAF3FQF9_9BILA
MSSQYHNEPITTGKGGDPTGTGQGGESIYEKPFKDEFHQRLTFNRRGLLGMANSGKDDNGSQFFITLGTDPQQVRELTRKHTLFGKIVGPTMFNMLKMTEVDVDSNERPKTLYKITGADVLTNPFKDIRPREKERRKKKKETKVTETKKLNLLSFGDEAEEDEDELTQINKKLSNKGKSAHDALDDEQLSKQVAVTRDEMADYDPDEDAQDLTSMKDEDLDSIIEQERKQKERERLDEMAGELKTLQKEYKKALRGPKERKIEEEEEPVTEVIAEYKEMRIKFKSKTKKLKSKRDEGRENQTMQLLERFRAKLDQAEQADILFDKTKEEEERKRREALKQNDADGQDENNKDAAKAFGYDLDAEDIVGTDWMRHTFVAQDEIDPNVTRAKDANLRDEAKSDWYDLSDPRHPINKRKRGEI